MEMFRKKIENLKGLALEPNSVKKRKIKEKERKNTMQSIVEKYCERKKYYYRSCVPYCYI